MRSQWHTNNNGYDNKFHLRFPTISEVSPSTRIFSPIKNEIILLPLQEIQAEGQCS